MRALQEASAAPPPAFDRDAIADLAGYAGVCEADWRDWFAAHSVRPFEVIYEVLILSRRDVALP